MGNHQIDSQNALVENRLVQLSDKARVTFADGNTTVATATRKLVCYLPAGCLVTNVYVLITELFNAAGTDLLTVGTIADDDLLLDDLDLAATNTPLPYNAAKTAALTPYVSAVEVPIYATYLYTVGASTTGICYVALEWVPWHERDMVHTSVGT